MYKNAYSIVVSSAGFIPGLRVLLYSLKQSGTNYPFVILCTDHKVFEIVNYDAICKKIGAIIKFVSP